MRKELEQYYSGYLRTLLKLYYGFDHKITPEKIDLSSEAESLSLLIALWDYENRKDSEFEFDSKKIFVKRLEYVLYGEHEEEFE